MAPDGSRRDVRVLSIGDAATGQDVEIKLSAEEEKTGVDMIARRKPFAVQKPGQKFIEFLMFDTKTRRYFTIKT